MKVRLLSEAEQSIVRRNKTYGVASSVVSYDIKLRSIFESLLGRTVVVGTTDDAISLARQAGYSFRIVTLEGEVINPQGSISGGSKKAVTSNLLMRDNEIESLGLQITKFINLSKSLFEFP